MPQGPGNRKLKCIPNQKGTPFEPGKSGNPGGRPKEFREFKSWCQNKSFEHREHLEQSLIEREAWAWQLVTGYGFGQPTKRISVKPGGDDLRDMSDADLIAIITAGRRSLGDTQAPEGQDGSDDVVH